VPYPGHVVTRWAREEFDGPIVMDLFLSAYDTAILDRAIARPGSWLARGLARLDRRACESADRVLLEITTDSEASVFRALEVAADALLHVRTRTSAPVSAFEIVLVTSSRSRGGQFLMTPALASQLADGDVELPAFYVQNVQY